jgi:hypothetical protein
LKAKKIQNLLNGLWYGKITNASFNLLLRHIDFSISVSDNALQKQHNLKFEGVSSYYFINNMKQSRFDIFPYEEGDYLELTSISYKDKGIGNFRSVSNEEWLRVWYSNANFVIEIWSSILFIEANKVVIDDEVFEVKYPK